MRWRISVPTKSLAKRARKSPQVNVQLAFRLATHLRWFWSSSNLHASRRTFFTVWPPNASRHKVDRKFHAYTDDLRLSATCEPVWLPIASPCKFWLCKLAWTCEAVWPAVKTEVGGGSIYVFSKIYQETSGFACWWKMVEKWFGSLGEKTGSLQTELWFVGCPCLNFSGKESLPVSLLTNISLRPFISLLPIPAFTCGSLLFFFTSCDRIFWPRLPITPWGHLNLTRVTCQVFCCFYGNGCFTILANIFVGN